MVPRGEGWSALFWEAFRRSRNPMAVLDDTRRHVDVNGAYVALLGRPRRELLGLPVHRFLATGPIMDDAEWAAALRRSETVGSASVVCGDGRLVGVQFAAHPETVTGRRLVLLVALNTSRWGRHFRRTPGEPTGALTARERQIAALIAHGESGPEIADELHISHETVRTHIGNAMTKVGARSRAQLVAKALGEGLIAV